MISEKEFWSRVKIDISTGCWIWTGSTLALPDNYGRFKVNGKTYRAHRHSWELTFGKMRSFQNQVVLAIIHGKAWAH